LFIADTLDMFGKDWAGLIEKTVKPTHRQKNPQGLNSGSA
jgi:hypothetical protein